MEAVGVVAGVAGMLLAGLVVIPMAVIVAITVGAVMLLGPKMGFEWLRERKGQTRE